MKNKIILLSLEPIEQRYTGQWHTELAKVIRKKIKRNDAEYQVIQLDGWPISNSNPELVTTPGAFLNFIDTNIWKNNQINELCQLFKNGRINPGDKIVFPDAWHSGIIQVKYMSELLDIPVEIHSIWHAGSYDSQDFLGRKIQDKNWSYNFERAAYYASNYNYFASKYHGRLIFSQLELSGNAIRKMVISGLPFEYLKTTLDKYRRIPKENLIVFPHRIAPEKQVEIFKDLEKELPNYEFVVCQERKLSKDEYHKLLARAKVVFSANLQETLGISTYEGVLLNCLPFVPNRVSYQEMYPDVYKYPTEYTESWDSYLLFKDKIKERLEVFIDHYDLLTEPLDELKAKLSSEYFNSDIFLDNLILNTILRKQSA